MKRAEGNGNGGSNHEDEQHVSGMDNKAIRTKTKGGIGATATATATTTTTNATNTNTTKVEATTANENLKRKASKEASEEPKKISYEPKEISDHIPYWKQYDTSTLMEQTGEQVIQLIDQLPYLLDSPQEKVIVADKEKLVAMMLSSSSDVVPHEEGNSLPEDVPDDSSLSLIDIDDDATFIKQLQSASATEVAGALKRPESFSTTPLRWRMLQLKIQIKQHEMQMPVAALARKVVSYVCYTHSQPIMSSMSLILLASFSQQAQALTSSQSTQAADARVEEQRLWTEEVNKYRQKEDKHVYERFANRYKYRDGIVNCAQDLIEHFVEELNKKELLIPDFMKLYKKCFEIAYFLDTRESWITKKEEYQKCLDGTLNIFRKFAKIKHTKENLLEAFQRGEYLLSRSLWMN